MTAPDGACIHLSRGETCGRRFWWAGHHYHDMTGAHRDHRQGEDEVIYLIRLEWRWLCRIGIHEWATPYKNGRLGSIATCHMCGKRRRNRGRTK